MTSDNKTKWGSWITILGSLLAVIAVSGKPALDAISGFPSLVRAFADVLPLGMWSFLLSAAVAGGLHWWVRTWHGRSLVAEVATIALAMAVTMSQAAFGQALKATAGQLLSAMWVGLLAGILGLFVSRAITAAQGRQP